MSDEPRLRLAYLVSMYPALSHTFIEREIRAMEARGIEVHRFSVRSCPGDQQISEDMVREASRTTVLLDHLMADYPRAHLTALRATPGPWMRTLGVALRSGDRTARARVWQSFYFAEAVVLYRHMRERWLRHVHVHFTNVSADVARLVVRLGREIDGPGSGWRWSMSVHGSTEFEAVDKFDLAAKVRSADAIMPISDFCRSQLMRLVEPVHWEKMRVIRMGVDGRQYLPPADGRVGRDGQPIRVLSVGRLVPEKGVPVLLEALAVLRDRGIRVETQLVGEGPMRSLLERRVIELGLEESVTLVGAVGQDDILERYHWADVFCLPSFQEGLPVVLMEALAAELPVVTTRIAAIEELVETGRNGIVVAPGRADLLADGLESLAGDETARRRYGRRGRMDVLAGFDPASSAQTLARALAVVDFDRSGDLSGGGRSFPRFTRRRRPGDPQGRGTAPNEC